MAETGSSKEEIEMAAKRLINEHVGGLNGVVESIDAVRDEHGNFSTVEVYFSDRGAALLRERLQGQDGV